MENYSNTMTDKLTDPHYHDALTQIALIAGIGDDDEYYPLRVSPAGNIRSESLVWNISTLAWEASSVGISDDPLAKYKITGIDPGGIYFGYADKDGAWYIMKLTATEALYAKGNTGYSTAWANKESQIYDYFFNMF